MLWISGNVGHLMEATDTLVSEIVDTDDLDQQVSAAPVPKASACPWQDDFETALKQTHLDKVTWSPVNGS